MAGARDELQGALKEGLGKLTGDRAVEAEGKAQKTRGRARRRAGGAAREIKGGLKSGLGKALDSPTLRSEGEVERQRGRIERT